MNIVARIVPAVAVLAIVTTAALRAQAAPPGPAAELKQLEPLVGNWTGKGRMTEPSGAVTEWVANATYAWAHGGHFVREDVSIEFHGMDTPLQMRAYLGWDATQRRYVNATATSAGEVSLHPFEIMADGTMVQLAIVQHPGMRFAQRSVFRVDGDTMTHTVDLLLPQGPSLAMVDGKFTRGGKGCAGELDGKAFMAATPHESLARLQRSAGVYTVAGTMVVMPGQPAITITGTDTFRTVFGGTVFGGVTVGEAEGMPGTYTGDVFWGHDAVRDCLVGIYVSNMGEVMQMDARWSDDGKLIATSSMQYMGQPTVQRTLLEFDAKGLAKSARSHSIVGAAAPYESFTASYTLRQ